MRRLLALLLVAVLGLTACGGDPLSGGGSESDPNVIAMGSGNFTESQLVAEIYSQALQGAGVQVEEPVAIGSREAYFPALQDGSVDLIPDYSGALLQYLDESAQQRRSAEVYAALQKVLPPELVAGAMSPAQDKDAVMVTRETADRLRLRSLDDLTPHCKDIVFGGSPEFQTRPDGIPALRENYDCAFKSYRSLDAGGVLTVTALVDGDVQAADLFTTDPAVAQNGLVVLEDPKENFAAQNIVPVMVKRKATPQVTGVLDRVSAKLTTEELLAVNTEAAGPDKPALRTVAADWLARNGLAGNAP
ncbi:osmoprotectant transport system substrate-binding protein [Pseudonocardia sediminis]|uniref:Osmoprotectant transport system substrate-binding protein n=1 Tax=Pseudonocardia sediminis TaxID=1397368 RepID=A0A4Q7V3H8_PSEST|nr:ABC transporter substrate-binding protein [Pseudonocardia sediminis]RZT88128.1 osmoprotectant transport system substrate-binding protein [Pseudonocardia sediminis]